MQSQNNVFLDVVGVTRGVEWDHMTMRILRVPITLMRGGTSKGVFLHRKAVDHAMQQSGLSIDELLLRLLGGNDPSGMQLDGLGGGISSTSKVAIIDDATDCFPHTLTYTFAQVSLKRAHVDWQASCINLAAAVALYAQLQELGGVETASHLGRDYCVKHIWQANERHMLRVHTPVSWATIPHDQWTSVAGVPGKGPAILVEVSHEHNGEHRDKDTPTQGLLPTGQVVDTLFKRSGEPIEATLLVGSNPTVFVQASALDLKGNELPNELEYEQRVLPEVEWLLQQAGERLGLPVSSAMRVCWVAPPADYTTTQGTTIDRNEYTIQSRITTEGRVHHAHTGTGALNLGLAASIPGTIPHQVSARKSSDRIRIGHPAGTMEVIAHVHRDSLSNAWMMESVGVVRTARVLLTGDAFIHLHEHP